MLSLGSQTGEPAGLALGSWLPAYQALHCWVIVKELGSLPESLFTVSRDSPVRRAEGFPYACEKQVEAKAGRSDSLP